MIGLEERYFLYVIEDGEWHRLEDVAEELGISKSRVLRAAERLSDMRFIHYDRQKEVVKIQNWLKNLPREEWEKPGKKSTGSVVIDRGGNVTIQDTTIYNELEFDVEIIFRVVDGKLAEISIGKLSGAQKQQSYPTDHRSPYPSSAKPSQHH